PELDRGATQVQISVQEHDVLGPCAIRLASDGACDLRVLDEPVDHDVLTRLNVRAHPDRQLGVALQALFGGHGAAWLGLSRPSRNRRGHPYRTPGRAP